MVDLCGGMQFGAFLMPSKQSDRGSAEHRLSGDLFATVRQPQPEHAVLQLERHVQRLLVLCGWQHPRGLLLRVAGWVPHFL
jgi:hypothetical protein